MNEWRDRGYVPDSDEEELALSDTHESPVRDDGEDENVSEGLDGAAKSSQHAENTRNGLSQDHEQLDSSMEDQHVTTLEHDISETTHAALPETDAVIHDYPNQFQEEEIVQEVNNAGGEEAAEDTPVATTPIVEITIQRHVPQHQSSHHGGAYTDDSPPSLNIQKTFRTYSRKEQALRAKQSTDQSPTSKTLTPTHPNPSLDPAPKISPMDLSGQPSQSSATESLPALPDHISQAEILAARRASVSSSDLSDVDMEILSSSPGRLFFRTALSDDRAMSSLPQISRMQAPTARPTAEERAEIREAIRTGDFTQLAAPLRNFRARKAIQLHPYLIESEQYRNTLRARGVRPVQVATNSQTARNGADDTQDVAFRSEESQLRSHTQESTPPDSSDPSQQHTAVPDPERAAVMDLFEMAGDDFPDLDVALRRHVMGGIQQGYKRRKTNETPESRGSAGDLPSSTFAARGKLKSLKLRRNASAASSISGMPPSPPGTSSPLNLDPMSAPAPGFRIPRGMTPVMVETPMASSPERRPASSNQRPMRKIVIDLSDSDNEQSEAESDIDSPSSSDREESQLLRMRKRIKGVLPASWLKLDRKMQHKPSTPAPNGAQHEATPQQPALLRGVAQRRVTSASATPAARRQTLIISDESDGSDSSSRELPTPKAIRRRPRSPEQQFLRPFDDDLDGEVLEHNEIDHMLPAASRPRVKKSKSTKRQSRLTDAFPQSSDPAQKSRRVHSGGAPSSHRPRKMQQRAQLTAKRRQKRAPHLSILDAPQEEAQTQSARRPQFVRVAARQARRRPDYGRHSPTQKTVRLATREDTHDALAPLRSWQLGNLTRSWQPKEHNHVRTDAETPLENAGGTGFRIPRGLADLTGDVQGQSDQESVADSMHNRAAATRHRNAGAIGQSTRTPSSTHVRINAASATTPQTPRQTQRAAKPKKVQVKPRRTIESNTRLRPAQLEGVATHSRNDYDMLTFAPPPSRLMELFNRDRVARPAEFRLERFLKDRGDLPAEHHAAAHPGQDEAATDEAPRSNAKPIRRRRLKQRARRFDVELVKYRQPNEPLPAEIRFDEPAGVVNVVAIEETLQGLGSFGVRYPTDFDVRPLETGTYFHQSTFIGSGDFQDSLTLRGRDLDAVAGRITIDVQGESLKWSAWDEDVSTGLTTILSTCSSGLRALLNTSDPQERDTTFMEVANVVRYLLRSLVRYCSGCLYFFDPVDRSPCVIRLSRFLDEFSEMLDEQVFELRQRDQMNAEVDRLITDSFLYLLSLSGQALKISQHPAVESTAQKQLSDKTLRLGRKVIDLVLPTTFTEVRSFLEDNRQHAIRDAGIGEGEIAAKTVVVVDHVLRASTVNIALVDILADRQMRTVAKSCNVQLFDQAWYDIFTIQPLLEIDAQGIFRPGSRFQNINDNWTLVKYLLDRLFTLYPASSQSRNASLNDYVRACLTRGYHLMARWGWHRCEKLLNTVYDYFAKNGLSQLHNEEGRGSARFLEELDKDPTVHVEAGDCAFQIFLKLLVVGLQGMKSIYKERQIRGIAWRFIPNHGRTHRKDQDVTQASLDALRNHHDLLCTLYWILPPGSGPRLDVIKDLVDHATSHREACRINVRAWGIIAKYQLSREEEFKDIDSLASWFKEMTTSTISQYRLARCEAEAQYAAEIAQGSSPDLSPEVLEMTIASNQRGIVATLLDLLQALQQAVRVAKKWETACKLVNLSSVVEVFKLFDSDQPRLLVAVSNTMDIITELLAISPRNAPSQAMDSQQPSEESQEYGEWSFMEDAVVNEESLALEAAEIEFLHEPLVTLLSSGFGSEKSPDDELLKKLVDVWTKLASQSVKSRAHDWSFYLDAYSTCSWFQLRNTEQKRKFTPYFLSRVIEADITSFEDHRSLFLDLWLVSLLERESTLKHQHILTYSLLNNFPTDPLLHNLPFAANRTGQFSISLTDLRSRRISLISSILSNMRTHLESRTSDTELRRTYTTLLKHAQFAMRTTYTELQSISPSGAVQSSYITFVQSTISLLQEHTSEITPIDAFFIDSAAFPLPAHDPSYVVGRLKGYIAKLSDARGRKQLAIFIQTVGERAAVDGVQPYLSSQIHAALTGRGSMALRVMMFTAILPAYIDAAASTNTGWVLASPLVKAAELVLGDLIYEVSGSDDTESVIDVLTSLLNLLHKLAATAGQGSLKQPRNLKILAQAFNTAKASLTTTDWLSRTSPDSTTSATLHLLPTSFVELGEYLWDHIQPSSPLPPADPTDVTPSTDTSDYGEEDDPDDDLPPDLPLDVQTQSKYKDTLVFASKNLLDDLSRTWTIRENRDGEKGVFVSRGNSTREVCVKLLGVEEEIGIAREAVRGFMVAFDAVVLRRGGVRDEGDGREGRGVAIEEVEVL